VPEQNATPGHFLFLGTGSHRALVSELTALSGAGSGVRGHVLEQLRSEGMEPLPSEAAAWTAFATLGHRPAL